MHIRILLAGIEMGVLDLYSRSFVHFNSEFQETHSVSFLYTDIG